MQCAGLPRVRVEWDAHDVRGESAASACRWTTAALQHVAATKDRVEYRIVLAASGNEVHVRHRSLAPFTPLRISFAVPWLHDDDSTRSNLVDLVAHEAFHLHTFLRNPTALRSEVDAYWVGLCAQLESGAELGPANLPGVAIDGADAVGSASSAAAETVRHEAQSLISQQTLSRTSEAGKALLARCARMWSQAQ